MRKVTMQEYKSDPNRYQLRRGTEEGAPPCPYGNQYEWVGYDNQSKEYIRFAKSVFKLLINS